MKIQLIPVVFAVLIMPVSVSSSQETKPAKARARRAPVISPELHPLVDRPMRK